MTRVPASSEAWYWSLELLQLEGGVREIGLHEIVERVRLARRSASLSRVEASDTADMFAAVLPT